MPGGVAWHFTWLEEGGLRGEAVSGGLLPGDRESGAGAVQRAGQRLGGAGAVDHGDLVVGEGRDAACGAALGDGGVRGGPRPEVGQRLNTAGTGRGLRDPLRAAVHAARGGAGLRLGEAVGGVSGVGHGQLVAGAAPHHRGGDGVARRGGLADDLDIVGRVHLPPGVLIGGPVIALDQRAVLLDRVGAVPVDADPERGQRGRARAAAGTRLGPFGADGGEGAAGVGVAGPVGGRDIAQALEARGLDAHPVVGGVVPDRELLDFRDRDHLCFRGSGMAGGGGDDRARTCDGRRACEQADCRDNGGEGIEEEPTGTVCHGGPLWLSGPLWRPQLPQMLTISGFPFNTLTFGYFYDYFVRSCRMKISENNKTSKRIRRKQMTYVGARWSVMAGQDNPERDQPV